MSVFKTCAFTAAAVLVAASTYAAPAQATTKPAAKPIAAKTTSTPKAKPHSAVGTLDKYDSATNMIVVNTGKGTQSLTLSSATSVRMGAKTMSAADLSSHTGDHVKVRYSELNGQQTVQSVQIEGKPAPKQTAAAKPSATPKPSTKK